VKTFWPLVKMLVGAALVMYALDVTQNAGSRAVAAIALLGWFVHVADVVAGERHRATMAELAAIADEIRAIKTSPVLKAGIAGEISRWASDRMSERKQQPAGASDADDSDWPTPPPSEQWPFGKHP
jgi:hypothetical protein